MAVTTNIPKHKVVDADKINRHKEIMTELNTISEVVLEGEADLDHDTMKCTWYSKYYLCNNALRQQMNLDHASTIACKRG
ncbi:hypothetical protein A0J61_06774 [Choanephora cucurbitarum]|uniref:Uncharacterized protein n=1 Tax=Choanephora cucurbitarum TaxID=101091 RepID=A0A1C7N7Z7_9FUNG|nr:hypothetical protein A0J61_06774 [Choanephora cucurbitarum]